MIKFESLSESLAEVCLKFWLKKAFSLKTDKLWDYLKIMTFLKNPPQRPILILSTKTSSNHLIVWVFSSFIISIWRMIVRNNLFQHFNLHFQFHRSKRSCKAEEIIKNGNKNCNNFYFSHVSQRVSLCDIFLLFFLSPEHN